ncbi:MAG: pyridoxal 5'-phosphate synthase glutaminase subunit PdxT [Chloroflexota bacterium]
MKIGVLAVQGAFIEHEFVLEKLGVAAVEVRVPEALKDIDGLIIPGGESTTISKLMREFKLTPKILARVKRGMPVMGTCAGMILLAKEVPDGAIEPLRLMDICVRRNAFGRQVDSFEASLPVAELGEKPFPCVFIRAPVVEEVGRGVQVLARLDGGMCVAARQGNLLALAFHPELTQDTRFHEYFLDIVADSQ